MAANRLLRQLTLKNFLSYGPASEPVDLLPLNVLIGPNGAGKSNLLEAIELLRATPKDLGAPIREGGGVSEWLWKGQNGSKPPVAEIEAEVNFPDGYQPLVYRLAFSMTGQRFELTDEAVENAHENAGELDVYFYYRFQNGRPALNVRAAQPEEAGSAEPKRFRRTLRREDLVPDQSVLSQRKDPDQYPEITYLGNQFARFFLLREWNLGRFTDPRLPQKPDLPDNFLLESCSNLALVLNDLQHRPGTKRLLAEKLKQVYDLLEDVSTRIHGNTVQLFVHEKGLREPVPATRISDGTLRYLCLLAILCHPDPPPLLCLEEPELGLHPDILPTIADLLRDASSRAQIVVTTHSDALVSALSDTPETVLVCERQLSGTQLNRLSSSSLKKWLEKYSLGELWRMGEIGGNRW